MLSMRALPAKRLITQAHSSIFESGLSNPPPPGMRNKHSASGSFRFQPKFHLLKRHTHFSSSSLGRESVSENRKLPRRRTERSRMGHLANASVWCLSAGPPFSPLLLLFPSSFSRGLSCPVCTAAAINSTGSPSSLILLATKNFTPSVCTFSRVRTTYDMNV